MAWRNRNRSAVSDINSTERATEGNEQNMKLLISTARILLLGVGLGVPAHGHGHDRVLAGRSSTCGTREATKAGRLDQQRASSIYKKARSVTVPSIVVPVCFHVVTKANGSGDLTDAQLQEQLDALNTAYGSSSCCDSKETWCTGTECSINTGVSFKMAKLLNNGNVIDRSSVSSVTDSGACVTRNANNDWASVVNFDDIKMKTALRKGDATVLNVYFVFQINKRTSIGYAYYPWEYNEFPTYDGAVIDYITVPGGDGPYDEGDTLVHEVGHWMGLLHTFEGGCSASDGVEDTPPEASENYGCSESITRDTCPGGGADPIFNFMDYSDDICLYKFTNGQAAVMQACWEIYRKGNGVHSRPEIELTLGVKSDPLYMVVGEYQVYTLNVTRVKNYVKCRTDGKEGDVSLYMYLNTLEGDPFCFSEGNDASDESCTYTPSAGPTGAFLLLHRLYDSLCSSIWPFNLFCSGGDSVTLYVLTQTTYCENLNYCLVSSLTCY
jgi:hypothetical protein